MTNGAYTAKLTVKDQTGLTAVENILISVGNRAPTVTIDTPLNGKLASFTDKIPYKVTVTDPEDGTTGAGIDCANITVKISLGHDEHAHDLSSATGCTGTLQTGLTAGHGPLDWTPASAGPSERSSRCGEQIRVRGPSAALRSGPRRPPRESPG